MGYAAATGQARLIPVAPPAAEATKKQVEKLCVQVVHFFRGSTGPKGAFEDDLTRNSALSRIDILLGRWHHRQQQNGHDINPSTSPPFTFLLLGDPILCSAGVKTCWAELRVARFLVKNRQFGFVAGTGACHLCYLPLE